MTSSQMRYYSNNYPGGFEQTTDFLGIIQSISPLTRVGALCFIFGKIMGILALPAAFIPALNLFVVPLVIIWGSMVFTAIALCSVDHYRKRRAETDNEKITTRHDNQNSELLGIETEEPVIIPLSIGRT